MNMADHSVQRYIEQDLAAPGDHGFCRGKSYPGRRILWWTRGMGEAKSFPSHVWVTRDPATIVHSTWPWVRKDDVKLYLQELLDKQIDVVILGRVSLTAYEVILLQKHLDSWFKKGKSRRLYAFGEYPLFIGDNGLEKLGLAKLLKKDRIVFFRRLQHVLPNAVCSGLTGKARAAVGWDTPDAMYDDPDNTLDRMVKDDAWALKAITPGAAKMLQRHIET